MYFYSSCTKKRVGFLTFLILLPCLLSAQSKERVLRGYLGVEGGESYTYKLVFTDSSGFLKGYSYTYLYENKEVKTAITGFIDRDKRTLSFKETNIIYNHGFESNTTICLINAVLKYKMGNDGEEIYSGLITSSDISNVYCGQGTVSFPYNEALKEIFSADLPPEIKRKPLPATPPAKPVKVIYDTARAVNTLPDRHLAQNNSDKITAGKEKFIEWHSDSIIIEIWDGGKIDGDIVSVFFNSSLIINKLTINKQPLRKNIPMDDSATIIKIIANNEGSEPPNTANILLTDGDKKHAIIAYNTIGKEAIIRLKKAK